MKYLLLTSVYLIITLFPLITKANNNYPSYNSYNKSNSNTKRTISKRKTLKIAVVDIEKVIAASSAANNAEKKMKSLIQNFEKQIQNKISSLQQKEQELLKKKSMLSKEKFNSQLSSLRSGLEILHRDINNKEKIVQKNYFSAIEKIKSNILNITYQIAQKRKYDLVIQKNALLFSKPSDDITQLVIKLLNRRLPNIDIK